MTNYINKNNILSANSSTELAVTSIYYDKLLQNMNDEKVYVQ